MMQWSYRHNPNKEYGVEMFPSKENYESPPVKDDGYGPKPNVNFGFMEIFVLVMVIPSWIFIYKFFYLLILPLIPISVVVFELIREVAPMNQLVMYGGSFLSAYLFYRGVKRIFSFPTVMSCLATSIFLYAFGALGVYLLLGYYPSNEVLSRVMLEMGDIVDLVKSTI